MELIDGIYNSKIAISNNIATYYKASSFLERKLKGETMIEIVTPEKTYHYYGDRSVNDKRWKKINFIAICIRDYRAIENEPLKKMLMNVNFRELQDWIYLIHGLDFAFMDDDECMPWSLGLKFERFHNNFWRRNASIPKRFKNITPEQFLHIEKVEVVEDLNKCFIYFDNTSDRIVIPTANIEGRTLARNIMLKIGCYFSQFSEPLIFWDSGISNGM